MAGSSRDEVQRSLMRPRAFDDSDDQDDDSSRHASSSRRDQEIVSFSRDGAKGRRASPKPAAPRVIPVASNLDWRQDRKERLCRATNLQALGPLVSMRRADSSAVPNSALSTSTNGDTVTDAINTEEQTRGLEIRTSNPSRQDAASRDDSNRTTNLEASDTSATPITTSDREGTDEEALKALLAGEGIGSSGTGEPLIIQQESESELLQHDIDSRPEAPTLDDYAATPIDQFGMALLRGMGWKEGMGAGKGGKGPQKAAEPKRRAALLGLGAKERSGGPSSLPTPSSSSRNHRLKDKRDYKYVPVAKTDQLSTSNGRSEPSDHRSGEGRHAEPRSRDVPSSRDSHRRDKDDRYASHSRSAHRQRSRSPSRNQNGDRERYRDRDRDRDRDRQRDDRDSERRSHTSSRSDRDRRSDRDGDERRNRDHRR